MGSGAIDEAAGRAECEGVKVTGGLVEVAAGGSPVVFGLAVHIRGSECVVKLTPAGDGVLAALLVWVALRCGGKIDNGLG